MKSLLCLFGAAAMAAAFASPAMAQQSKTITETHGNTTSEIEFQPAGTNGLNLQRLRDFGSVKGSDPALAKELARKPSLVKDDGFVRKHPALQAFLEKYPDARDDIEENPGNYLTPVARSK
jgi:hypothetical protein